MYSFQEFLGRMHKRTFRQPRFMDCFPDVYGGTRSFHDFDGEKGGVFWKQILNKSNINLFLCFALALVGLSDGLQSVAMNLRICNPRFFHIFAPNLKLLWKKSSLSSTTSYIITTALGSKGIRSNTKRRRPISMHWLSKSSPACKSSTTTAKA